MKLNTRRASTPSIAAEAPPADAAVRVISMIDNALPTLAGRTLVTATEVVDLLLDLRREAELERAFADLVDAASP